MPDPKQIDLTFQGYHYATLAGLELSRPSTPASWMLAVRVFLYSVYNPIRSFYVEHWKGTHKSFQQPEY